MAPVWAFCADIARKGLTRARRISNMAAAMADSPTPRARYENVKTIRFTVTLPPLIKEYLKRQAWRENRSASNMLATMIEFYQRDHPER